MWCELVFPKHTRHLLITLRQKAVGNEQHTPEPFLQDGMTLLGTCISPAPCVIWGYPKQHRHQFHTGKELLDSWEAPIAASSGPAYQKQKCT